MPEDKEPPAEASPPQSEVTLEYYAEMEVLHVISSTPPTLKTRPSGGHVPPQLAPFKRPAWVPVVEDGDGTITDSKFAGTPWLGESEEWPRCPNCGNPIQLFLQLNLAQLPEAARGEYGEGLLQLFYCTNDEPLCDVDCEAFFPFAASVVARLVSPEGVPARGASDNETKNPLPPKRIVGWRKTEDYPGSQEADWMGVELGEDEWNAAADGDFPLGGDKLGGWPLWVQDVEYPDCPECGSPMRLVFQIDSENNLPVCLGDLGTGHVTQCPEHKGVLAFGWACT